MSCSCCSTRTKKEKITCPVCNKTCLSVSLQTVLHQVKFPDNQHLLAGDYAFCSDQDCTVGYFSAATVIAKSQLRAFQPEQIAMLCHCFDISQSSYRAALADGTAQAIKAYVIQKTKESLCACKSRNPSGRCCLADFQKME
jgi:hypothetical protein